MRVSVRTSSLVACAVAGHIAAGATTARAEGHASAAAVAATVRLSPAPLEGNRFRYILELGVTGTSPGEVVADRRLLGFVVRPDGSRPTRAGGLRCVHPGAPARVPRGRVRTLGAGAEGTAWREWVDLRMYCWGKALTALDHGATVDVSYGFRRGGRARWVARPSQPTAQPSPHRSRDQIAWLAGESFHVTPLGEATDGAGSSVPGEPSPLVIDLAPVDVGSGSRAVFHVSVRAGGAPRRVYLRPDLVSFVVRGPLGEVSCAVARRSIAPIVDLYSRVTRARIASLYLSASEYCPPGTMDFAGIYEVVPTVDFVYGAEGYELDDVFVGSVTGDAAPVRVSRDDRGYVEQAPAELGGSAR